MFSYPLMSKPVYKFEKISHYELLDGEIVQILAKYMNFTTIYITSDDYYHGFQMKNGTFTGGLAAVEYGLADLIANHRVMTDHNTSNAVFLKNFYFGRFFFIIRKSTTHKEVFLAMLESFDLIVLFLFLGLMVFYPFGYFYLQKLETNLKSKKSHEKISFMKSVLTIKGILNNVSVKLSGTSFIRIFLAVVLFQALIQTAVIQGVFVKNLSVQTDDRDVKTLNQLLDLNFQLIVSNQLRSMFKNADGNRMSKKIREIANGPNIAMKNNLENFKITEKMALLVPETLALTYINNVYDNKTKKNLYKKVPEVAFQFYESMMVPKNSPFQDIFSNFIQIILQAGINQYQLNLAHIELAKIKIKRTKDGNFPRKNDEVITVYDLRTLFELYIVLNLVAIITFIVERLCKKIRN